MFKVVPTIAIWNKGINHKLRPVTNREYRGELVEELGVVELVGGVQDDRRDQDVLHKEDRKAGKTW